MKPLISLVLSLSVGLLVQIDQSKGELESALVDPIDDDSKANEPSENKQRLPQVIRSVNPSAVGAAKFESAGEQLAKVQPDESANREAEMAPALPGSQERAAQQAGQVGADQLSVGKRSGFDWWPSEPTSGQVQLRRQQQQPLRQEQLMNLLLSELPMLEFEPASGYNGNNQRSFNGNANHQQQPSSSLRQIQIQNGNAASGQAIRLRSRSTFPLGYSNPAAQSRNSLTGGSGPGSAGVAAYQISPMLMGSLDGSAVNGFTKRPNAHHVPCFFNAITCF